MSRSNKSNKIIVRESKAMLDGMKYEIAAELGLYSGGSPASELDTEFAGELGSVGGGSGASGHVHWSTLSTRQAGSVGGEMTRRLIAQAEQVLKL
jgi:hypothetical protein